MAPDRLELRLASDARGARLVVLDDGTGFAPRRGAARRRAGGGGFGMTSMRERARALGGDVRVTSAPGRGTMVRVRVPRPAEATTLAPVAPAAGQTEGVT